MAHIDEASSQNLAATRQTEQAAHDLNELGSKLKDLLAEHEK
jgi:methyl-accepting chemotaxis protein